MDWNKIPNDETINQTKEALMANGFNVEIVDSGSEAKEKVMSFLPEGSRVLTSASLTLEAIGIHDEIEVTNKVVSVRKEYMALDHQKDGEKIRVLRATPEIVIGSVHAVTKKGEVIIASNTGSQIAPYAYSAKKVIWVVGAQKIVKDLEEGNQRLYDYVVPLENKHMQSLYGVSTNVSKLLIFSKEIAEDRVTLIFVKEKLGF